jgi:hypothetical protein
MCCFRLPGPANSTACKRRNEFCVELNAGIGQPIVRCWRLVVAYKLRFKSIRGEPLINLVARDFESRGKSDVGVERCQRFVSQLLRQRMQSVQAVRPAANNNGLIQPRPERLNQPRE